MVNSGIELWKRARKLIPGGNELLSKRAERFLPGLWPSYYKRAKGCEVWDLDGNHYYDFAQMGVGSCILGYADDQVDAAVIAAIKNGSMCTLNSYEEIELTERLIDLHPWAEMARYSRMGGEACAMAVRIARAATGRDRVAFCGYHGWHDWYLSANLANDKNLDGQLLPGLVPRGVPRGLIDTALPFHYNRIDELEALVSRYPDEIGVIIMEPRRGTPPVGGFLEGVRNIASRIGAVLIYDEISSGFRLNPGGIHLTMGVNPDIAIFGKALGNGYPISAIIGRREVMDSAQETFISSTFGTERLGFVAGLAALKKMVECKVHGDMVHYGELLDAGWTRLSEKHGLKILLTGVPSSLHFEFAEDNPRELLTLYVQYMLNKGYLLSETVYTSYAYSEGLINGFLGDSDEVFGLIRKAMDQNKVQDLLKGEVINAGFIRLT